MKSPARRPMVAVIGNAKLDPADPKLALAREVGRLLVESGCRVVTGGLGGIMAAAMQGAKTASTAAEGDTIAVLPSYDPADADPAADIVLATGMNIGRNIIVANADAVIVIGGGAGTLSEIAIAWQLRRPVVALAAEGWSKKLAGTRLDERLRQPAVEDDQIHSAATPAEAVQMAVRLIPQHAKRSGGVRRPS